ncbi:PAP-associated domain-containing [Brachionus plicatilis]|uniref:polynucleotide adenylyltransferase n=1 Tax=Brachionus plicatilis TaxID=10195 RepID=A0A3M7R8I9_BRAPC|nr:PAP-associated domain-containing [Brachionus plicatilis]
MDPRIGWHPSELMNSALCTWADAWMNSQSQSHAANLGSASAPNLVQSAQPTIGHNATSGDLTRLPPPEMDRDQKEILNNLRTNRKLNKASTYGFNLPSNQHMLEDPMSTPWMARLKAEGGDGPSRASSVLSTSCSSLASSSSSSVHNDETHNTSMDDEAVSEGLLNLHKEIVLFSEYISPTLEELYMRNEIIMRITRVIKEQFPLAEVDVFGSYKTGLFLPTSDIDMVVIGEWKSLPLNQLKEALIKDAISDQENIKCLDKATVPIIKILEANTELKVDISFNTVNGVKSAELIKKFLVEFPCLRPLVMVLKQFLIQRDYNEVWTGGIGSYSLILMTVSFLQLHPRIDARALGANLAVLLIEFFEFYGRCFNYMKTAIRVHNGGSYLPKDELLKQFANTAKFPQSSVLCIEDPLNPLNDIGKGSYGALKVKQAFEYAYYTLSHSVLPQNEFIIKNSPQSILGRIIRITREVRDYRSWVKKAYQNSVSFELAKSFFLLSHAGTIAQEEKKAHKFLSTNTNHANVPGAVLPAPSKSHGQPFAKKENQENRQIARPNMHHHKPHYNNYHHNHNHYHHHNNHYHHNYHHNQSNHHHNFNFYSNNKNNRKSGKLAHENMDLNKKVKFPSQDLIDRSETFSSASSTASA